MITVTSESARDPVTDHLLTPQNAALVVIDYQPSQVQTVTSMDRERMIDNIVSAIPFVKSGLEQALAVTGAKRSEVLPDLPTVAESGVPGYAAVLHYGIVAPAGTPRPIVDKLAAALRVAIASPDVQGRIAADGAEVMGMTPEEYAADIDREETKWSEIVRRSGAKGE